MLTEPLSKVEARQLARKLLSEGTFRFSTHAQDEMENDDLDAGDVINMLRCGFVTEIDVGRGGWTYRFETRKMAVVIAFPGETTFTVVTAWRIEK